VDAIQLPHTIAPASPFAASPTPFQPGQAIQALVLDLIENDIFRLQLPQAVIDVSSTVALTVGSTITLAVKSTGANPKLAIYAGNVPAQSIASRDPIGEATVIGRAAPNTSNATSTTASSQTQVVRDAPSVSPAPATTAPSVPVTPDQALGDAVRVAASRQTGSASLFANLEQITQAPAGAVPTPVRDAAAQLAALRVPLDETLSGADVKQAFQRSGVLLEQQLAAQTDPPAGATTTTLPAGGDLKSALLVLRQTLQSWAGDTAPQRAAAPTTTTAPAAAAQAEAAPRPSLPLADPAIMRSLGAALLQTIEETPSQGSSLTAEQVTNLAKAVAAQLGGRDLPVPDMAAAAHPGAAAQPSGPPPPYRGAPLSAQQPAAAAVNLQAAPHESAERLLAETDGAIARTTLLQAASLPDQQTSRSDPQTQRWTFEVPFATQQGTSIAQFEVSRDPRAADSPRPVPSWRARFTLDVEPMGSVHALIGVAGTRTSVTLWAERPSTAQQLNANAGMLGEALRAAELEPAEVQFRVGTPPKLAKSPVKPGRFMDRAT
jgi:flagellar hook-length control protein FliK